MLQLLTTGFGTNRTSSDVRSSDNAELKSLLQTGLKIFQGHEQHAEHVASALK